MINTPVAIEVVGRPNSGKRLLLESLYFKTQPISEIKSFPELNLASYSGAALYEGLYKKPDILSKIKSWWMLQSVANFCEYKPKRKYVLTSNYAVSNFWYCKSLKVDLNSLDIVLPPKVVIKLNNFSVSDGIGISPTLPEYLINQCTSYRLKEDILQEHGFNGLFLEIDGDDDLFESKSIVKKIDLVANYCLKKIKDYLLNENRLLYGDFKYTKNQVDKTRRNLIIK